MKEDQKDSAKELLAKQIHLDPVGEKKPAEKESNDKAEPEAEAAEAKPEAETETSSGAEKEKSDSDSAASESKEEKTDSESEKKEDRVDTAAETKSLQQSLQQERKETKRLQGLLKEVFEVQTKGLSDEDKALLVSLAGEEPDRQIKVFNQLRAAGKIGNREASPIKTDSTRVAGEDTTQKKPDSWSDADKRVLKKLRSV